MKEKVLLNDFREYRFLSELEYAPDGKNAALVVSQANKKNGYDSTIWAYRPQQGFVKMTSLGKEKGILWLDNRTILFASQRDEDRQKAIQKGEELTTYYKLSLDGGEAQEAFTIGLKVGSLKKIPNRENLYLVSATVDTSRPDLEGKTSEEKDKLLAQYKKENEAWQIIDELPYWSNGRHFTNKLRHQLYLYDSAENKLARVSAPMADAAVSHPSPCGRYIAYTAKEYDSLMPLKNGLYLYSIESGETKVITKDVYRMGQFDFWKDGKVVFAASLCQRYGNNENPFFYLCDLKTGKITQLAEYDHSVGSTVGSDCRLGGGTSFQVQGDYLYFTSVVEFYGNLYRMNLNSGAIELLSTNDGCVDMFALSQQGDILAAGFYENRLQEVYFIRDGARNRLSSFNEDFFNRKEIAVPQYHPFVDADGVSIDGWVLLPRDYDPAKKYPAILDIHGGPKSLFGDLYFHEMQYWSSEGYFVLFCNPRGGDGKGNEFADVRGKYGTIDYDDIMRFTDKMLEQYPAIDPAKVGVTGGSYGGFMTNWIIGHTHRFAAAATQRSIANWLAFNYVSDIGYFFGPDQQAADNWNNPEKLWFHSPLKYLDNAKTPTLVIHSDQDHRCPDVEGYQIFSALKVHGVDARMVLFHGENHELSRSGKPDNREKRLAEITAWMDRYLK